MIKQTALFLLGYVIVAATALYFYLGYSAGLSCFFGGGLMLLNLATFYFAFRLIFAKKSIALTVLIIISKYLILGLILWNLTRATWIHPLGLVVGLSTLVLAIVSMTATQSFVRKNT